MKNVHEDDQEIFQTRWAMSYLRGPITKNQIKELMRPVKSKELEKSTLNEKNRNKNNQKLKLSKKRDSQRKESDFQKPTLPVEIKEYYLPISLVDKENTEKNQSMNVIKKE
ncbi:MAG: hypothetical protein ACPKQO_03330 [Nitrososphaeraceae archaeon]